MDIKEIEILFKRGLESLKMGKYVEAEALLVKAKQMTLELQKKQEYTD